MKISLLYIVKNEENNIVESINSCKQVADEIIVVDTGSIDNTKSLCKGLGACVYDYVWEEDFSKARNYALSLCKGDIIIFLDADEYFVPKLSSSDKELIKQFFQDNPNINGLACPSIDIEKKTKQPHHTSNPCKFFRNIKSLNYKGKIHEMIFDGNNPLIVGFIQNFTIYHTGYSAEVAINKVERNLKILNQLDDKRPIDYFYLTRENFFLKHYEEAERNLNIFFSLPNYLEVVHTHNLGYLIYCYKQDILSNLTNKYTKKDILNTLLEAKKEFPYIPEIYYRLGIFYINSNPILALKYFQQSIKVNEHFGDSHFELNNFLSFQSKIYYYMAKIYSLLGQSNAALRRAEVACMLDKKDKDNLGLLLHLLRRGNAAENKKLIDTTYYPKTADDYEFLITCLSNTDLYMEFIQYAAIYNIELRGGNDNVYFAMMLSNHSEEALASLKEFHNNRAFFLMSVVILFSNSIPLYNKYCQYLSSEYRLIVDSLINNKFDKSIDMQKTVDIISKLLVYGVKDYTQELKDFVVKHCTEKQLLSLIAVCNNNSQYAITIDLITKWFHCRSKDKSDNIISHYLFTKFALKDYESMVQSYESFFPVLQHKDIQLGLLRIVKTKKDITEDIAKHCENLIRRIKRCPRKIDNV